MKTGNKAQVIALSLVAVGAIGFLGSRLIPAKAQVAVRQATDETPRPVGVALNLPVRLLRDPFSHPRLASHKDETTTDAPPQMKAPTANSGDIVEPQDPSAGYEIPSGPFQEPFGISRWGRARVAPNGTRQKDRSKKVAVPSSVKLEATMSFDNRPVAMISFGKNDARSYSAGDPIEGGRVVAVDASKVVLKLNGRRLKVKVGETKAT